MTDSNNDDSLILQNLNSSLRQRLQQTVPGPQLSKNRNCVLYLPTVVLRHKHNPSFALACEIANHCHAPLVVLAVVLDDWHLPSLNDASKGRAIVATARRLAFVLEALQSCCGEWQAHGAGVAIRIHGTGSRIPHHLQLATKSAVAVVTDEPFVHPYLRYVQSVERACAGNKTPVFRVDGSTTIAPVSRLPRQVASNGLVTYRGVPDKAWKWQKATDAGRKDHVRHVVVDGHFHAPVLKKKLPPNFLKDEDMVKELSLPKDWSNPESPSPGRRPWSADELADITDIKEWVMTEWSSNVDTSVSPCTQTYGCEAAGYQRWDTFRREHLKNYARLRNDITKPHAVSRMSCYLNYGIVSIFSLVWDLWQSKSAGTRKYLDEIVKWREIGYVHAFGYPESYNREAVVPQWSRLYLSRHFQQGHQTSFSLEALESCGTDDVTWNAMQSYLNITGELHNNARMTWGKTIVHWQKSGYPVEELLQHLVYLNDRFALDGLSPPSYAGLLWCLGWCDKPQGGSDVLSIKPTSRYRHRAAAFEQAKNTLLRGSSSNASQPSIARMFPPSSNKNNTAIASKKQRVDDNDTVTSFCATKQTKSIKSYFQPNLPAKSIG